MPSARPAALAVVGVILSALSILTGWAPAGAATPTPLFGMRPSAEGQTPLPGGHFSYSVPAGATVSDAVVVENMSGGPLTLRLFGADLIALQGGGFGVTQLGQPTHSVGSWLSVATPTVTLPSGSQQTVPFTVHVPATAFSGDYGGAVVAQNAPSTGHGIAVQFRVALQVRIHVTGRDPHLAAQIGSLSRHRSGKAEVFTATLTNTGNESFVFDGTLHLQQSGSPHSLQLGMSPARDYLLPGQHLVLTAKWPHTPAWGSAHAQASVLVQPALGPSATFRDRAVSMRFFPWWLVLMAILALLLLLLAAVQVWRNRRELRRRAVLGWRRRQAVRRFKGQLDADLLG